MNADDEIFAALNTFLPLDKITNRDVTSVYEELANGRPLADAVKAAYAKNVGIERKAIRTDEELNPGLRTAAQLVGGVAGAFVPVAKVTGAAGTALGINAAKTALAPMVARGMAQTARVVRRAAATPVGIGALQGGVSGFAAGEGSADNRLAGAQQGAVTGAVLGGAFATISAAAPLIRSYWNAAIGTASPGAALEIVVGRLKRDGYDLTTPEGKTALEDVLSSFGDKPVTLADVGTAVRSRAGVALRSSGEAQRAGVEAVTQRAEQAGPRLEQDIQEFVSSNPNIYEADDLIVAKSAEAVEPLYKEAYERTLAYTDTLGDLLKRPSVRDALKDAARIAGDAGEDATKLGFIVDSQGNITGVNSPTMKTWDYISRALRESAEGYTNLEGKFNAKGQGLMDLRKQMLDELDTLEPAFGEARGIWRGRERMRDALRFGREILTKGKNDPDASPERIAAEIGKMSPMEQELARMGAARKFTDDVRAVPEGGDPTKVVLNTPLQRDRLQSFFIGKEVVPYGEAVVGPSPSAVRVGDLKERVAQEKQLGLLAKEVPKGGPRVTLEEQEGYRTPGMLNNAMSWAGRLAQEAINVGSLARNEALNNELLPLLLQQDPKLINETITTLSKQGGKARAVADRVRNLQRAALRGGTTQLSSEMAVRAPIEEADLEELKAAYP